MATSLRKPQSSESTSQTQRVHNTNEQRQQAKHHTSHDRAKAQAAQHSKQRVKSRHGTPPREQTGQQHPDETSSTPQSARAQPRGSRKHNRGIPTNS